MKTGTRPQFANSRKALRKEKRQQKKLHRREHYLNKSVKKKETDEQPKYSPGRFVKRPTEESEISPEIKKKKVKPQISMQDVLNKERQKEKNEVRRLTSQMESQRKKIFLKANEDEDKIIKKLEKQLGLNKSKNKNSFFADDGLDYLLEICDRTTSEQIVAAEKHLADVEGDSDFEEDLAMVTGKVVTKKTKGSMPNEKNIHPSDNEDNDDDSADDDEEEDDPSDKVSDDSIDEEKDDDDSEVSDIEEYNESDAGSEDIASKSHNVTKTSIKVKPDYTNMKSKQDKSKKKIVSEENLCKVFSDDEVSHLSSDNDTEMSNDEINESNTVIEEKKKDKPDIWEDIYGRKRDREGNIIKEEKGVYIPPHLRNKDATSDKQLVQLKRQIKSVLNKLSSTNLHWACSSIEDLYSGHSRNSVNSALTELWMAACVAGVQAGASAAPDRLLAEHTALVAVLHGNIGTEIGAHFLQDLVKRFDVAMEAPQPMEDKTLDNLVSCLAHLYNFKIYHATLLYDIMTRLLESISEKNIECVSTALRCAGGVLRRDAPQELHGFIQRAQRDLATLCDTAAHGSRIKFLLEVLMAVKNNNLTKIPNYDPTYTEHLRKMTRGILRKGNYITPLNIRLEDLLKAEERGKWWVVGSAWEGTNRPEEKPTKPVAGVDQKLLELARKQRMNTDVRRSIFCVIMSAEDYMDAFEKLQRLGLKAQQEREIVHVTLACCLQESVYNPYYAVLARQLCFADRKYQLSIQFTAWDKIKELENMSKQHTTNLAQFLVHLIMEKALPLSVLKIIQFSDLNKRTVRFMRQILMAIIMHDDVQSSLEVFQRIAKSPKLHMFRESLRLFIRHFLVKKAGSEGQEQVLRDRAGEIDRILSMYESKMKL